MVSKQHSDKVEPIDVYRTLWSCRDFELSHLWQRSVFLSAFLLLVYTSYGALIFGILSSNIEDYSFKILLCLGLVILLLGMIFSQLWIMMGKGSKAWYEMYEKAIYKIEHSPKYANLIINSEMKGDAISHGDIDVPDKISNSLWNTKAGAYSPSKINIVIGQISFVILFLTYLAQTTIMTIIPRYQIVSVYITLLVTSIALLLCMLLSYTIIRPLAQSSYMKLKSS